MDTRIFDESHADKRTRTSGSPLATGGSTSSESKIFQRLIELRDLYELHRKELGISISPGMAIKELRYRFTSDSSESDKETPNISERHDIKVDEEDVDIDDDADYSKRSVRDDVNRFVGRTGSNSYKISNNDNNVNLNNNNNNNGNLVNLNKRARRTANTRPEPPTSVSVLQATIKSIIERNGGSCHLETITEFVKMKWQREGVSKSDGRPFGHADCKKAVQANFRTRANNRFVFLRDKLNEGCWTINTRTDDEKEDDSDEYGGNGNSNFQPLHQIIAEAIEEHGGNAYIEDIYDYVHKHWKMKPLMGGSMELSKKEVQWSIRINLATHPKYEEDSENQDYYLLSNKKKKKPPAKENPDNKNIPHNKGSRRGIANSSDEEEEDDDGFSSGGPTWNRTSRPYTRSVSHVGGPPRNHRCRCGVTEASKSNNNNNSSSSSSSSSKWKRIPSGEWVCHNCSLQYAKKHSCPVCGKQYKKNEDDEDNPWIRCDDCHRWVMIKCDHEIQDLILYDDSNPNHLHYSCPMCRKDEIYSNALSTVSSSFSSGSFADHLSNSNSVNQNNIDVNSRSNGHSNNKTGSKKTIREQQQIAMNSDDEYDLGEGRIESTEKNLVDKIIDEYDSNAYLDDEDLYDRLHVLEENFCEDISRYATQLVGKRNSQIHKNQLEYERQLKRLKEDKERLDETIEIEFIYELKNYYRGIKKDYDRQRISLLRTPSSKEERF